MTISSNPRVSPTNSVEDTPTDRPPMAMTAVPQAVAMGAASASASANPATAAAAASPSSTTETNITPVSANTAGSSCGSEVNGMPMIQQPSIEEAEHREPSTTNMVPVGTSASSSTSSSVPPSQSTTIKMKDKAVAPKKTITAVKKTTALKKKKKPKKRKFSSILSGMMQKSRTESNSLQYERELLRKHLGGGNFRKVEQI